MASKNKTFWPDDIAEKGWAPIARPLLKYWNQFDLDLACFATLVWVLRWGPHDKAACSSIRIVQRALAEEMGVAPGTPGKHLRRLEAAGLIRIIPDGPRRPINVDITPLFTKLREAEALGKKIDFEKDFVRRSTANGFHVCPCGRECRGCGRPQVQMSHGWGVAEYEPLDQGEDLDDGLEEHDPPENDPVERFSITSATWPVADA